MSDKSNYRRERIERLLVELRYEIERGMLENEIEEMLEYRFIVPISRVVKDGVVFCQFRTEPMARFSLIAGHKDDFEPRLRVIEGGKQQEPFITGSEHGPGSDAD